MGPYRFVDVGHLTYCGWTVVVELFGAAEERRMHDGGGVGCR
jgi:hypothetical protein